MNRKKWISIIKAIKCKMTCCCQSTCNQPKDDRTVLKWVDDDGKPKQQIII